MPVPSPWREDHNNSPSAWTENPPYEESELLEFTPAPNTLWEYNTTSPVVDDDDDDDDDNDSLTYSEDLEQVE